MFKKPVDVKALQRLSGADKKKLRRAAKERFPRASDSDFDLIIPPKTEVTVAKYPNRLLVYGIEGGLPMLFDIDGRGRELFPTVYAMWLVPELVPSFMLKGGEVSQFIIGGADLMFPGISIPQEGLFSFTTGEPFCVKVPGNPAPIAVGVTTMSNTEALKAGLRGKALRILHTYHDCLWSSAEERYVPNAGFYEDAVFADPSLINEDIGENSESNDNIPEAQKREINEENENTEASDELTASTSQLKISEGVNEEEINNNKEEEKDKIIMSVEETDNLLDKCLLQALHTSIKDKDLPIPGSTFWVNYVLPCRPSGITLDIKKSSHKKLSKWLQSKHSSGLITAKEDKHKKETILTSINRRHADYISFKPEKKTKEVEPELKDESAPDSSSSSGRAKLEVVEIYKPNTNVNQIFVSVGADVSRYYTASEASDVVFSYIEKENLVNPSNKSIIILDPYLCDSLYKGSIKKGSNYPSTIHKKDLSITFLNRMQIHYCVSRGNESVIKKGGVKPVQILTERRSGNKKVTRVSGLEGFLVDSEGIAGELQKKFACSTTVNELPGKKGQNEVLVQGGVIDDLAKYLVEHYGVPKKYIEVYDKTKR